MCRCADWSKGLNILQKPAASIFRLEDFTVSYFDDGGSRLHNIRRQIIEGDHLNMV
jgi:hypothetical protein